jgi:hypothetical protein
MCQKCVKVCHGVYGWFSANSRREAAKPRRKTTYSIRPNRRDKNTFLENVPSRHAAKNRLIYLIIGAKGPENVSPSVKMCHFGFWPAGKQGPAQQGALPRFTSPKTSEESDLFSWIKVCGQRRRISMAVLREGSCVSLGFCIVTSFSGQLTLALPWRTGASRLRLQSSLSAA